MQESSLQHFKSTVRISLKKCSDKQLTVSWRRPPWFETALIVRKLFFTASGNMKVASDFGYCLIQSSVKSVGAYVIEGVWKNKQVSKWKRYSKLVKTTVKAKTLEHVMRHWGKGSPLDCGGSRVSSLSPSLPEHRHQALN